MKLLAFFVATTITLSCAMAANLSNTQVDSIRFKSMSDPGLDSIIVAKVGNVRLTAKDFVLNYYLGPSFSFKAKNPRHALLDAMVDEALIGVAARDSLPCIVYLNKWLNGVPHFGVGPPDTSVKSEIAPVSKAIYGDLITEQLYRKHIWDTISVTKQQLDKALMESQKNVRFRWLYSKTEWGADSIAKRINAVGFDSAYSESDSAKSFRRSDNYFDLKITSPQIYDMMNSAKEGEVSEPIHGPDGYYIFRTDHVEYSPIMTASERATRSREIEKELRQYEADVASDRYVNEMLKSVYPVIKWAGFSFLCGNIAKTYLPPKKFDDWRMSSFVMSEAGPIYPEKVRAMKSVPLIKFDGGEVTLGEFFQWWELRSANFNISTESRDSFLRSIEGYVWRMLRDQLLTKRAEEEGLGKLPTVVEQMGKWNLKLSYLSLLQHMSGLMRVDSSDVRQFFKDNYKDYAYEQGNHLSGDTASDFQSDSESARRDYVEFMTRSALLHTLALVERYVKVEKFYDVVDRLALLPPPKGKLVDAFFFKTGGTFPRKAFPTIDEIWQKIIP